MRAISIWQPWASLWLTDCKIHETRGWETKHLGELAVHAAQKLPRNIAPELDELCIKKFGPHWRVELPRGYILGVVDITACESTNICRPAHALDEICGDFSTDRFAWRRSENYRLLRLPVPYVGRQGLFHVDDAWLQGSS